VRSENSCISYAQFVMSNIIAGQCYICEKQIYYDGNHQRMHNIKVYNGSWLFYFGYSRLSNFSATRRLHNYRWQGCKFKHSMLSTYDYQELGFFYAHYLLRHGTLDYTVSSEGLAGIRVPQWDSNPQRKNQQIFTQCTMRAT
jgi:hypothetical protein